MSQHLDNLNEIRRRLVERRRELASRSIDDTEIDQGEPYGKNKKYNQGACIDDMIKTQQQIDVLDKIIVEEMKP